MKILAVNAGSSSLKVQLLEMPEEKLIAKATVERIGANDAIVTVKYDFKNGTNETYYNNNYPIADHAAAVKAITDKFAEFHVIENVDEIKGVGHRVVQGGEYFKKTEVVTDDVCKKVLELAELAPHHNKAEYNGYMAFKEIFPNAIHTMVFDTAFHQTIPAERYVFALPYEYYEKYKIRRYGAHGTSHKYIASVLKEYYGKDEFKAISCHLGSGASLCAIENGKSVDTSMGFTPLGGIAMGTRCGDLDPSTLFYIMNKDHLTPDQMNHICNFESGLLGVSGVHDDMRKIDEAEKLNNPRAFLARKVYCTRVAQFIGSYFVELGGADAIVFTAGVGENSISTRSVLIPMIQKALGIEYTIGETDKVEILNGKGYKISGPNSKIDVFVIPTNEELMMCKDTYEIVKGLNK
ncbi:MAG: acetate kinase [Candidatus Caccosoma sp.]|nr:acetate kinase [Candidatus Caccosoma sp.]